MVNEILAPMKIGHLIDNDVTQAYKSFFKIDDISGVNNLDELSEYCDAANRNLYIMGDISSETGVALENMIRFYNQIDRQFNIEKEDRIPIKIWINSYGGDLQAALTTCDAINLSETPIYTINQGQAASAAALIFLAGHKRIAFPKSYLMIHEGSIGVSQIDAHKFQAMSDFYKVQRALLKKIIIEYTGMSEEDYTSHAKDDWWMDVNDAMKYNMIDIVMDKNFYQSLL
jgi:ATP-dependent Clp protease protease subunit